jgi:putative ABC transport system permease protein
LPLGALGACTLVLVAGRLLLPRVIQVVHAVTSFIAGRFLGLDARLATDNLPRDIGRTAATATGLMAGAALMVGFATFDNSFLSSLNTWSSQSVPGDLFVTSGAAISGLSSRNIPIAPELGAEFSKIPGMESVQTIRMTDYDYKGFPVKILSVNTLLYETYGVNKFLEGTKEDAKLLRQGKVTVSENFSHRFNVHKGDTIQLSGKQGSVPLEVATVMVDYSSDIGTITMEREIYQKYWDDTRVDTFELHLAPGTNAEEVRRLINERFGEKYDLFVLTNSEFRAEMVDAAAAIFSIMRVLEYIMLVVAALGVINSLLANIMDRIREIGVLRALGMLRGHISRMIVLEATLVGLVGVAAGALTGSALGYVILKHVTSVQTGWHFPYAPPWQAMGEIALIALPISAVAGFFPARQAAGLVVRDALDYE